MNKHFKQLAKTDDNTAEIVSANPNGICTCKRNQSNIETGNAVVST